MDDERDPLSRASFPDVDAVKREQATRKPTRTTSSARLTDAERAIGKPAGRVADMEDPGMHEEHAPFAGGRMSGRDVRAPAARSSAGRVPAKNLRSR